MKVEIKGLFETHLFVKDLKRSIHFYSSVLDLEQCHYEDERRVAFFWIGKPQQSMLGIWESTDKIDKQHFAFECEAEWVLNESCNFLEKKGLACRNFLNDGTNRPMVFAWMPAISIYFDDPDGHELEFIAPLKGKGRSELGILTYEKWTEHHINTKMSMNNINQ